MLQRFDVIKFYLPEFRQHFLTTLKIHDKPFNIPIKNQIVTDKVITVHGDKVITNRALVYTRAPVNGFELLFYLQLQ